MESGKANSFKSPAEAEHESQEWEYHSYRVRQDGNLSHSDVQGKKRAGNDRMTPAPALTLEFSFSDFQLL